jgi:PAS domain S-box-containing protein
MNKSGTILIADDDQGMRSLLASILSEAGLELLSAVNGKEALQAAAEHVPDLVLLDILMPVVDGFEVCRRLRSDPKTREVPIIMITALGDHASRLHGIEAGADDFITKPFDPDELLVRVRTIIRLNRYRTLLSERAKSERLFELSPDGILVVDSEQNIVLANPAMRRLIGAPDGLDLGGKPFRSLITPDQRTKCRDLLGTALTGSSLPAFETRLIRLDGTRFPVEMSAGGTTHGEEAALYLIVRDITERRRFQESLWESERKHRELVENIEDIVYVTDGRGVITFVNDALERSFGYTKKEIIGRRFVEFLVPEDYAAAESIFKRQLGGEKVGTFEISFFNKDNSRITFEMRERLIWEGRTVVEVHGIGRDITERKRIQEELHRSEQRLSGLFETSKDVIFICNEAGRFVDVNPAGQSLLKYPPDELLGLGFADICSDPRDNRRFGESMAAEGFVKDFEITLLGKDRATIDGLVTATETHDSGGGVTGFQGIIRDVTEKKRFVDLTLDGINDGVFTTDDLTRVTYVNSAAEEILSIAREESIGKTCCDVVGLGLCENGCALKRVIETGREIIQSKTSVVGAGKKKIPVSLSATVLRDRDGVHKGVVVILRDLSAIEALRKEIESSYTYEDIISRNHRMRELFNTLPYISESGSTVLVEGRSGTGKELFARAIHNLSPQRAGPFIAVNCSAIPDTLLESELFGYVKGAFTNALADKPGRFALAEGGTLFLDEITDLPRPLQAKLLRVLEERQYDPLGGVESVKTDARIIASSNRSVADEVRRGAFREDLFYRLNVIKISLPELKERREDIPLLVDHFLRRFSERQGKEPPVVSGEVMRFLMGYDFPGNVREMENIINHACVLCRQGTIYLEHLPRELTDGLSSMQPITVLKDHLMDSERELIRSTLAQHKGDRAKAALALNIGRTSLWRKMKKYHLL